MAAQHTIIMDTLIIHSFSFPGPSQYIRVYAMYIQTAHSQLQIVAVNKLAQTVKRCICCCFFVIEKMKHYTRGGMRNAGPLRQTFHQ